MAIFTFLVASFPIEKEEVVSTTFLVKVRLHTLLEHVVGCFIPTAPIFTFIRFLIYIKGNVTFPRSKDAVLIEAVPIVVENIEGLLIFPSIVTNAMRIPLAYGTVLS